MSIIEYKLGYEALKYIKECLTYGNTFSNLLLKNIQFDKGNIRTFLPDYTRVEETTQFEYGGKFKSSNTYKQHMCLDLFTVSKIKAYLLSNNSICFIENYLASDGDPWLTTIDIKTLTYNKEIYHVYFRNDVIENRIINSFVRIKSIPIFVGALIPTSDQLINYIYNKKNIEYDILLNLAKETRELFIVAYDGEGYIYWSKD